MAFKNPKMDKGHRTQPYTAEGKQGHWTARGTNTLSLSPSYPPPSVSGDQLFSTINTHVSTSGSVNYTYNHQSEGQILASFQTKQKTSTVWIPSTKARGRRWMDRAPTPLSKSGNRTQPRSEGQSRLPRPGAQRSMPGRPWRKEAQRAGSGA